MSFTDAEREYLAGQRLGRVATASANGVPDVAPVTFTLTPNGQLEIDGLDNPKTLKWRNVSATGRAAFVVDDLASIEPWSPRGVKLRGPATADTDPDGRRVIRITPDTIWSWGINSGRPTHFGGIIERRQIDRAATEPAD